ncbi:hypothetical protein DDZ14_11255 [Maritimibacter sp. 55A14]|uniref:DUF805 domain-containing protein n=1 Tax=Maritimibacter sp. 55A14 TaxID=2174844 RepID=UPI000D60BCBC|nr:DUF805 domain-containing protein [Maritimibacter sp. 55A14]PWE32297.1 hypothetical protein DDZ14_11255 [Maritimibacter sp. 55A14]
MSKPVTEDIFAFRGRRNRKSYLLFALLLIPVLLVPAVFIAMAEAAQSAFLVFVGALFFLPVIVSSWAVGSQRCRDFGWTGWAILISVVPIVGMIFALALFVVPGTKGANRYGPDPLGGDDLRVPDLDSARQMHRSSIPPSGGSRS